MSRRWRWRKRKKPTIARERAPPFRYQSPIPGIGAFISPGKDLRRTLDRVSLADRLGFDSVYTTHLAGRDSLSVLMAYAAASERVRLGTGVVPIFSRTPATMAQTAATIDEYSGGRMVLGLGVSHKVTVENWHGQKIDKPVTQMREYLAAVRAILRGEDPPESDRFPTRFRFMGYGARAELPVYVAALSPNMIRLAAQAADGVMLWLCSPAYIRDTVVPALGAAAGDLDIVAAVPVALTDDIEAARAAFRQQLVTYASLPFYRTMLEASGFADDLAAFDAGMAEGDVEKAKAGLSDGMLSELAGIGDTDEVRGSVQRYREAGAKSPCVGAMPGTDFDGALEVVADLI